MQDLVGKHSEEVPDNVIHDEELKLCYSRFPRGVTLLRTHTSNTFSQQVRAKTALRMFLLRLT